MKKIGSTILFISILVSGLFGTEPENQTQNISEANQKVKETTAQDISDILESIARKYHIPAMAALLIKGDSIVFEGITGVRKKGAKEKATINDLWHLGSCTKSMTATLCAILVEKGILKWELTLEDVFPDVAKKMHKDFKKVTLSQLLTNRGGFPGDLLNWKDLWDDLWHFKGSPKEARRYLLERIVVKKPETAPGTKDVYSNFGFAVAGHIAETVTGQEYEDLMQQYLFVPLRMKTAGWGAPGTWNHSASNDLNEPWGHKQDGSPVKPLKNTPDGRGSDNPTGIAPAARLHCTIKDWAKYISIHLRGNESNPYREYKIITSETFKKLQTPPDSLSDYGYGWMCLNRGWSSPDNEGKVLTHSGSNTMWYSFTWIAPQKDYAVLVCCNIGGQENSYVAKGSYEASWAMIEKFLEIQKMGLSNESQSATNPQQNP